MSSSLVRGVWWMFFLRGLAAASFGALVLARPHAALTALALLAGVYALADGVITAVGAIACRKTGDTWRLVRVQGLAGIAVGVTVLLRPGVTMAMLLLMVALRWLTIGAFDIMSGSIAWQQRRGETLLLAAGVAVVLPGLLAALPLGASAALVARFTALATLIAAALLMAVAIRLRIGSDPRGNPAESAASPARAS